VTPTALAASRHAGFPGHPDVVAARTFPRTTSAYATCSRFRIRTALSFNSGCAATSAPVRARAVMAAAGDEHQRVRRLRLSCEVLRRPTSTASPLALSAALEVPIRVRVDDIRFGDLPGIVAMPLAERQFALVFPLTSATA